MKQTTSRKFWPALVIFSLVGQVAWVVENMYFNVFLYKMFHADPGSISLMVTASAVAAAVTTILIGALSDKIGKRKLFICGGYLLWGISIASFALLRTDILGKLFPATVSAATLGISLTIVMDCVMTFFGSSANDACFNAWLTEAAPKEKRGAAEGLNAMMPLLAILAVFGGFMGLDTSVQESWTKIFLIIGGVVFLIGLLGIFLLEDHVEKSAENASCFRNIFYGFRPKVVRSNPMLYLALLAFALFNISIQIFMPYLILYYDVSLQMENYVLVMGPAVILASLFTAFYGRVYDKRGFRTAVIPSMLLLMLGYVLLFFLRSLIPVFTGSLLMMCGYLSGMAVFGAVIRDRIPEKRAGMFQGLRIVSQVLIPGIIGPAIAARVLKNAETIANDDGTRSFIPHEGIFLAALIAAVVVWPVLCVLFSKGKKERHHGIQ